MRRVCLILALSLALPSHAMPANTTIPHFSKVNDTLYRGGRPKPADLSYLKSLNVRAVINLQGGDLNNPRYRAFMKWWEPGELVDAIIAEMNLSKSLGLLFYSKPLAAIDPVSNEDDARIDAILDIMGNPAAQPVFVHCEHGIDRTGLIVALYEVKYMGASPDDAYQRWRASGHKGIGAFFTGHLDDYYWRKLGARTSRKSALRRWRFVDALARQGAVFLTKPRARRRGAHVGHEECD